MDTKDVEPLGNQDNYKTTDTTTTTTTPNTTDTNITPVNTTTLEQKQPQNVNNNDNNNNDNDKSKENDNNIDVNNQNNNNNSTQVVPTVPTTNIPIPITTTPPQTIITPSLHSPPLSGKYLPLTQHLSKLDIIKIISELENITDNVDINGLESLFIEKNKLLETPEKGISTSNLTSSSSPTLDSSTNSNLTNLLSDSVGGNSISEKTITDDTSSTISQSQDTLDKPKVEELEEEEDEEEIDEAPKMFKRSIQKSTNSDSRPTSIRISKHGDNGIEILEDVFSSSSGSDDDITTTTTTTTTTTDETPDEAGEESIEQDKQDLIKLEKDIESQTLNPSTTVATTTTTTQDNNNNNQEDQSQNGNNGSLPDNLKNNDVSLNSNPLKNPIIEIKDNQDINNNNSKNNNDNLNHKEQQRKIKEKKESKLLSFLGLSKKNKDQPQKPNNDTSDSSNLKDSTSSASSTDSSSEIKFISKLPSPSAQDGHVFLLYGDLTKLVCDVKMVPCSNHSMMRIALSSWLKHDWATFPPDIRNKVSQSSPPDSYKKGCSRVYKLQDWPVEYPNISQPWFTTVVPDFRYYERLGVDWYIQGAIDFLTEVGKDLQKNKPKIKNGRAKYLVALPILGTGGGGGARMAGSILSMLLHELYVATRVWKYDVVLVTNELSMYTAARNKRREMMLNDSSFAYTYSHLLGRDMMDKANQLAKLLDQGKLVLFLGAGCSRSAGLPTWAGLLQCLGEKLGMSQEEMKAMDQLHYLDRATILENRWKKVLAKYSPPKIDDSSLNTNTTYKSSEQQEYDEFMNSMSNNIFTDLHKKIYKEINVPMQTEIANLMKVSHSGLSHYLLASTPATDIITTNYDRCFEIASNSVGISVCVLPYETISSSANPRWILKLHGCVSKPEDIVITREDYIKYGDKREALSGILQSSLITKHILFIGFSLVDDNFFQVMSAVKSATQSNTRQRKFGTALFIQKNDLMTELWGNIIEIVNFDKGVNDIAHNARTQEIFLEYLSSISITNTSHLMESRFDCLLKDGEKIFRDRLIDFVETLPDEARDTQVYKKFENFLSQIGYNHFNASHSKNYFGKYKNF